MNHIRSKGALAAGIGLAAALGFAPVAASAASGPSPDAGNYYPVSGTVYEDGAYYQSANVHYEGLNDNTIRLNLTSIPCADIKWRLVNQKTGQPFTQTKYYYNPGQQVLATHVLKNTYFYNSYAAIYANAHCGDYNFNGSESY